MPERPDVEHVGVASCAGNNCHGAVARLAKSSVPQNEYIIWSKRDKHRNAYAVLLEPRAARIARNLNLAQPANKAPECLGCHADNAAKRGRLFRVEDGVGCEACHGGAGGSGGWLGVHIAGLGHQANLQAGLYPTDQTPARSELCLSCHLGNDTDRRFSHRILGAGHPPLGFELDTYTAVEPAHFVPDAKYVARKGPVNDAQIWAIGQALSLVRRMDVLLEASKGPFPELSMFDCQSCHHSIKNLQWQQRGTVHIGPGVPRINDANAVMLRVAAMRVAPEIARAVADHTARLDIAAAQDRDAVPREAEALRKAANDLAQAFGAHDFTPDDMKAMADGVLATGLAGDSAAYSGAEQATMALQSVLTALKSKGAVDADQAKAINVAMGSVYDTFATYEAYRPNSFVNALRAFGPSLPRP